MGDCLEMDAIEHLFLVNLESWKEYCQDLAYDSPDRDCLDCNAYINIVRHGREFLPFIKEHIDKIPDFGLVPLVRSIIGDDFQVPEEIKGDIQKRRDFTVSWLEENLAKYI